MPNVHMVTPSSGVDSICLTPSDKSNFAVSVDTGRPVHRCTQLGMFVL